MVLREHGWGSWKLVVCTSCFWHWKEHTWEEQRSKLSWTQDCNVFYKRLGTCDLQDTQRGSMETFYWLLMYFWTFEAKILLTAVELKKCLSNLQKNTDINKTSPILLLTKGWVTDNKMSLRVNYTLLYCHANLLENVLLRKLFLHLRKINGLLNETVASFFCSLFQ